MSDNTVNGKPREITARYSGQMHESVYVMLTVSPNHPDDPRSRGMMDTKKRKLAHSGEVLSLNYSMTLHGREAWDGGLKESECHVNNEEELIALRAGG